MLSALLIGSLTTVANLAIQVLVILLVIRHLLARLDRHRGRAGYAADLQVLGIVLGGLFLGHLLQFATWALLFMWLDEFTEFNTAFYHSAVNFASLGYGDMVMSERWRLLGPLEATNGVLMLSLSAGSILAVMRTILSRHALLAELQNRLSS